MRIRYSEYKARNLQANFIRIYCKTRASSPNLSNMSLPRPYTLANPPQAPRRMSQSKPYSLRHPPRAPKKEATVSYLTGEISRLVLPPTPRALPPPTPKKRRVKMAYDLTPIPIDWRTVVAEKEAAFLAGSGSVREKYLTLSPKDIEAMVSIEDLEKLWEMYFPFSQPRNNYEESYLSLMRDVIDARINFLSSL